MEIAQCGGAPAREMIQHRRRELIAGFASLAFAGFSHAADVAKMLRIGFLANTPSAADLERRTSSSPAPKLFEDGLRDLGWVDGRNIQIVWRSAEGRYERLGALVDEMVRMPVDVIVAFGPGVKEAASRTASIPIVMGAIGSVEESHVGLLSRPERNITGMSLETGPELEGKRLALLKEAAPHVKRVALLNATSPPHARTLAAATALGMTVFAVRASSGDVLGAAFAEALAGGADAMLVTDWPAFNNRDTQLMIHALARRHRLPAIYSVLDSAASGGLMSYGSDILDNYRRVPYFVDRILRGAKPAEIPIEQPRRFALEINLGAARAIGLTMPPSVLAQADRVIPAE